LFVARDGVCLSFSKAGRIIGAMPKRSTVLPPVPLRKPTVVVKPLEPIPPLKPRKPDADGFYKLQIATDLSEGKALMGIRDFGEWKAYAAQRFVGILHMIVRNSLATRSPIPEWAAKKVKESWNVQER